MSIRRTTRLFNVAAAAALTAGLVFSSQASASGAIILPPAGIVDTISRLADSNILFVWSGAIILPPAG
jgi:hypothetical protein